MKKTTHKSKILRLIFAVLFSGIVISGASAQISGTKTVCASGCDYSSIGAAISALQVYGINGATTIEIAPGNYNENIYINSISGISSSNTLTIEGGGSSPEDVHIYASNNYNYTLQIMSSSYITLKNVWIDQNNSYDYNYYGPLYLYQTSNCTITNCRLTKDNTYYNYGGYIIYSYYNTDNIISDNVLSGGTDYTIQESFGTRNTYKNNDIKKFNYFAIYGYNNTDNNYIGNNIDSANSNYNNGYGYGFEFDNEKNSRIENNKINAGYYGILIYRPSGTTKIINNMINISENGYYALYFYDYYNNNNNGDTANVNIYHNTFNRMGSNYSNELVAFYNDNYYYDYYYNQRTTIIDFKNNNLTSPSANMLYFYNYNYYYNGYNNNQMIFNFEGNNYYSPNGFTTNWNNTYYYNLSDFKTAVGSSTDQSTEVSYVSSTDLHLSSTSNAPTAANCGVNNDIDGDTRGTTVTAGADEGHNNAAPVAKAKDVTVYLDANGAASISMNDVDNGSSDDDAITSSSLSKSDFDCSNLGENTIILTVTDAEDLSSSDTAIVTVLDNISPVAATQDISVILDVNGDATITASDINNGSSDNCSIVSYSLDKTAFDCSNVGENTVTLTVTDASGNTHSATATVTVKTTLTADAGSDKLVYYGYTPLASATLTGNGANGGGTYTYEWNTGATTQSITVSPSATTTYTVTVTDNNGCTATDKVIVEVNDVHCGNKNDKVMMCHNGHEICIASSAVAAHLSNHKDCYLGACKSSGKKGFVVEDNEIGNALNSATNSLIAYPNPFIGNTTLQFSVATDQAVTLSIYDVKGSLVKNIFSGNAKAGVVYKISLDAGTLSANMYFCKLIGGNTVQNIKIIQAK